ncbi:MAG: hypothetical protein D6751_04060 [Deltaproteobacteria bacterium]|nr:MAG: hypothetical protein D6751_04060 [Deltaproteobacteria bacterium]
MESTRITISVSRIRFIRDDWTAEFDRRAIADCVETMREEYGSLGIELELLDEDRTVDVGSYADLLNAIRLRSSRAGLGSPCLGHVIGASPNRDVVEDLRRGVGRVAFAPETIAPDGEFRRVCHNCGCGC